MASTSGKPVEKMEGKEICDGGTVSVLYRGMKHKMLLPVTLGKLRSEVASAVQVEPGCLTILARGKKIDPRVPDATALADYKIKPGTTLMLSVASKLAPGENSILHTTLAQVREVERQVQDSESDLSGVEERIRNVSKGFLNKEQTFEMVGRIGREGRVIEERLMRLVITADGLTCELDQTGFPNADAQWRAERKAVIVRAQTALRRCDEVQIHLKNICDDEFGEYEWRRGKKS
jgi:BAG domain